MRERDIEQYLVRRVKELGGEVRKVQWLGRRGAPDRVVMLPSVGEPHSGFTNAIWVELKSTGKKPEPHQFREHQRMRAMGQYVAVVDSIEGIEELLT